jgi:excisionase family DNA binding protein
MADTTFTRLGKMTVSEVAAKVGVIEKTVRRWIAEGCRVNRRTVRLASTRVGTRIFISDDDLAAFRAAINGPAPAQPEGEAARNARYQADLKRLRARGINV